MYCLILHSQPMLSARQGSLTQRYKEEILAMLLSQNQQKHTSIHISTRHPTSILPQGNHRQHSHTKNTQPLAMPANSNRGLPDRIVKQWNGYHVEPIETECMIIGSSDIIHSICQTNGEPFPDGKLLSAVGVTAAHHRREQAYSVGILNNATGRYGGGAIIKVTWYTQNTSNEGNPIWFKTWVWLD